MQINFLPMRHRVLRVIVKVASVAVLLLLILWLRVFYGSMQDYKTGETLLKENQTIRAITYFDRSLHWYAPLNPYVERSAKQLWEIGERAESEKDTRMALIAYESIRNGFYGASHVFRPGKDWIQRAENKMESLSNPQRMEGAVPSKKDPHPHVGWSVAVVLGFLGWIGSALGFIVSVLRKDRKTEKAFHKSLLWVCLILTFVALWVAGMVMA